MTKLSVSLCVFVRHFNLLIIYITIRDEASAEYRSDVRWQLYFALQLMPAGHWQRCN
jgi:hypothetical protein